MVVSSVPTASTPTAVAVGERWRGRDARGRTEQIALGGEGVDEAAPVRDDQHDRGAQAEAIDCRRARLQCAVERQVEHRRHHQRHDREEQHG